MARDGLTDILKRYDPTARHLAYNNTLDRTRIELPPSGDPAASGVVQIDTWNWPSGVPVHIDYLKDSVAVWSASGTPDIPVSVNQSDDSIRVFSASGTTPLPVYLDAPIPVAVAVDIDTDSIKVWSASGTAQVPVLVNQSNDSIRAYSASGTYEVPVLVNQSNDSIRIYSASGTTEIPVYSVVDLNYEDDSVTVVGADPSLRPVHASGLMNIQSASGTPEIPIYLGQDTPLDVVIQQENDDIRIYSTSGTLDIPTYQRGPIEVIQDTAVDLNVTAVATDLDIRDIDEAQDDIRIYSTSGTADIPVYLQSDLDFNNDSVTVFQGTAANLNATVTATDLDIRNIDEAQDDIRIYSASGTPDIPVYIADEPVDVYETDPAIFKVIEKTWSALTGPSTTPPEYSIKASKHTFQYTVASIDTNVSVAASGSLDNTNWFNLDANDALTTQTANGTYGMVFDGMTKYVLFAFMAETGGTSATITPRYLGGH